MNRFRIVAMATASGIALAGWLPADAADGAEVTAVGWWSQRPIAGEQPDGGFEVASGIAGAESIAAIAVTVDGEVGSLTLTVTEAGGLNQETAPVKVCRTTDEWAPANPGEWADRPTEDCTLEAPLTRSDGGATWTAEVGSLLAAGSTSLVLVPGAVDGELPPVFQLQLGQASLAASAAPTGPPTTSGASPPTTSSRPVSSGSPPVAAPTRSNPVVSPAPRPQAPATTAAPPTTAAAPAPPVAEQPTFTPAATRSGSGRPWGRVLLYVPVCALIGFAVAYGRTAAANGRLRLPSRLPFPRSRASA